MVGLKQVMFLAENKSVPFISVFCHAWSQMLLASLLAKCRAKSWPLGDAQKEGKGAIHPHHGFVIECADSAADPDTRYGNQLVDLDLAHFVEAIIGIGLDSETY